MGWSDDFARYTLCEAAQAFFSVYTSAPMMVVNVFDPAIHVDEEGKPDVSLVKASDIIGGVDQSTLKKKGLELISEVFPRYRDIPSTIIAPKFSCLPEVAVMLAAKCQRINGLFQAIAIADIDPDEVPRYTDVPAHKENFGLVDPHLYVCWPKVRLGDQVYHISSHAAGIQQVTDYNAGGFPHVSPSNESISITGVVGADGESLWLGDEENNYLNGQGVVTVSSFDGGYKLWGNRTSAYPSNTNPKDAFTRNITIEVASELMASREWVRSLYAPTFFGLSANRNLELTVHNPQPGEEVNTSAFRAWTVLPRGASFRVDPATTELFVTLP